MPLIDALFNFKLTAAIKPADYQECLVYSPCEGFMVATWKRLGDEPGFYLFATYERMHPDQSLFWTELPTAGEMDSLRQIVARPNPIIKKVVSQQMTNPS